MGIAALVIGIIAAIAAIVPLCGMIVALPAGVIGAILGIIDIILKSKKGAKKGVAVAGTIVCVVAVVFALIYNAILVKKLKDVAEESGMDLKEQFEQGMAEAAEAAKNAENVPAPAPAQPE